MALAAIFGLGEQLPMVIEFRRQAHTIVLGGPGLVLGALLAPVPVVVLARLIGSGLALGYQRKSPAKWAYNVAAFSCEAALATTLVQHLVRRPTDLDLAAVLAVIGVMVAVDQVFSMLVLLVIRLHDQPVGRRDVVGVLVPSAVVTTVTTAVASGAVMMIDNGAAGTMIVAVTTVTAAMLYRGYLRTRSRHEALELVHDFVTGSTGTESVAEAAHQLLDRIRTLLRAARVEMARLRHRGRHRHAAVHAGHLRRRRRRLRRHRGRHPDHRLGGAAGTRPARTDARRPHHPRRGRRRLAHPARVPRRDAGRPSPPAAG